MTMWFCEACRKSFHHQGIAMHRQTHRDKKELVTMTTLQYRYTYDYRKEKS